jgi:hypothetical protein
MNGMRSCFFIGLLLLALTSCTAAEAPQAATPEDATGGSSPEPMPTATIEPTETPTPTPEPTPFNFYEQLTGRIPTLSLSIRELELDNGKVVIDGMDARNPNVPFAVEWGDGEMTNDWFPFQHTYADLGRNYIVRVTATYSLTKTGTAEILVRFVPPVIDPIPLPENLKVSIPDQIPPLASRLYPIPGGLSVFDDEYFSAGSSSRAAVEYVLSLAARLQYDFANEDVYSSEDGFRQIVLRNPDFPGMYSLWFTDPVTFVSGEYGFRGSIQYSSFFHEMGHNFTLNSPADYYTGGRIDGPANAIYSETMANIFAHATAYEMLRNIEEFGLDEELALEIRQTALFAMMVTRSGYESYLDAGKSFHSWNDQTTPEDETFDTIMTIAFKFCERAEQIGGGYRGPLKRMMSLLQKFNPDWRAKYSQHANSPTAEAFRATWMVAALSYAFSEDLRGEFRALNFPIDDTVYDAILNAASG